MSEELWTAVDDYFSGLLLPPDAELDAALADSAAAGLPAINVTAHQGKFLMLLAKLMQARRILDRISVGSELDREVALAESGILVGLRSLTNELAEEVRNVPVAEDMLDAALEVYEPTAG